MTSLILRTATRFLHPLLLLFAVFLLLRGHNEPGGGFSAGLIASAAFALYSIAYDVSAARAILRLEPRMLIGYGLLLALGSAVAPLLIGRPLLTGLWGEASLPGGMGLTLGSPLFFDIGVFMVVLGVTLMIIFTLEEEE